MFLKHYEEGNFVQQTNIIDPNLVEIGISAKKKEEVLEKLAERLTSNGYVKDKYLEAILERERLFPTGLLTADLGVAIPHADSQYVIKPGIAIGVLKEPVKFNVMGNPDEEVEVRIVFMLSIKNPSQQINLLKKLVSVFENKHLLKNLSKTQDNNSFACLINSSFYADNG